MIVPLALCSDQCKIEFLIQRRYGYIKSVNDLCRSVAVCRIASRKSCRGMCNITSCTALILPRPSIWQSTESKASAATNMLFQESSSSPAMSLFAWSPATTENKTYKKSIMFCLVLLLCSLCGCDIRINAINSTQDAATKATYSYEELPLDRENKQKIGFRKKIHGRTHKSNVSPISSVE